MGLFDKLKNMFTEEEEETTEKEPIKKEVFQVEIPAPKIEEKKEELPPKKEEKFVFPVYFDDADFEDVEPIKPKEVTPRRSEYEPRRNYDSRKDYEPKREYEQRNYEPRRTEFEKRKEVPKEDVRKRFKLSPVISPVYGILDKNYKKEDITLKKSEEIIAQKESAALKVDRVRKKAYGTLEDELENGLDEIKIEQEVTSKVKETLEKEANESDDMFFQKGIDKDMTLEEAIKRYEPKENDELDTQDELIESDLFNLIDSMYDKNLREDKDE